VGLCVLDMANTAKCPKEGNIRLASMPSLRALVGVQLRMTGDSRMFVSLE
jgi:hypothetical protein